MVNELQLKQYLDSFKAELVEEIISAMEKGRTKRTQNEVSDYMSTNEVCLFFGKSRTTINKWIGEGQINSVKKGNNRLFVRKEMNEFKEKYFLDGYRIRYYRS